MIVNRVSIIKYTNSAGQSITFDNLATQKRITSQTATGEYFLNRADEHLPNQVFSDRVVDWHGETVQNMYAGVRTVNLEGFIFQDSGNTNVLRRRKLTLEKLFNPTLSGDFEYQLSDHPHSFFLRDCRCDTKVIFDVMSGGYRWHVVLKAYNPFWQQRTQLERLSFVQPNALFRRSYPQVYNTAGVKPLSGKMYHGLKRNVLSTTVNNVGDVETGFTLRFIAHGEVDNPFLENMDTGETIRLITTMQKDDVIQVTSMPKIFGIMMTDGSKGDMYLDPISSPFFLPVGQTNLRFGADLNVTFLDVLLEYPPLYLGAENT